MEEIVSIIFLICILILLYKIFKSKKEEEINQIIKEKIKLGTKNLKNNAENINDKIKLEVRSFKKNTEIKISNSYLIGSNWYLEENNNIIYTFRSNNDLLITTNGIVKKCHYEYIVDNNSLIITIDNITEMYFIVNIKDDKLILHKISNKEILVFSNLTKLKDNIKGEFRKFENQINKINDNSKVNFMDYYDRMNLLEAKIRMNYDSDELEYIRFITGKYYKSDKKIYKNYNKWVNTYSDANPELKNSLYDYIIMLEDKYKK
ncbi:MAG: hypothetical protein RSC72_11445 [Algoriella sp.]|uniref:hypothetical protein n=1 Tax=Algoriella sp. TaxID=1872434 RepID=UPI002FC88C08